MKFKALLCLLALSVPGFLPSLSLHAEDSVIAKISKQVEEEANKAFNDEYKAKIQREALEKYPDIKVGDNITVPIKFGKTSVQRSGILKSVSKDYIVASFSDGGDRKVMKNELPEETVSGIDGENYSYRSQYLQKNFYQAKNLFKKAVKDRLFQENGFIYDADAGRWVPKSSGELPGSSQTKEGQSQETAPVKVDDASLKEIKTTTGEVYNNVSVNNVTSDGIEITHSGGSTFLKFELLDEGVRKKFNFVKKAESESKGEEGVSADMDSKDESKSAK